MKNVRFSVKNIFLTSIFYILSIISLAVTIIASKLYYKQSSLEIKTNNLNFTRTKHKANIFKTKELLLDIAKIYAKNLKIINLEYIADNNSIRIVVRASNVFDIYDFNARLGSKLKSRNFCITNENTERLAQVRKKTKKAAKKNNKLIYNYEGIFIYNSCN